MSHFQLGTALTASASHLYLARCELAGVAWVPQRRLLSPKLGSITLSLIAMTASSDDGEHDSPQILATIKEAQSGSSCAYGRIVERYQQAIAIQMRRFSRDLRTCEELTHDVFVEAYTSLHSFRFGSPFLHWLRRIAVRVGYRFWKSRSREALLVSISDKQFFEIEDHSSDLRSPSEAAEIVHHLLSRLTPADRLVLTVIYLDGCSIKEAAYRCRWTVAGTKLRLFRARRKMVKLLEDGQYE